MSAELDNLTVSHRLHLLVMVEQQPFADGEEPGGKSKALIEAIERLYDAYKRFLRDVLRKFRLPTKPKRKASRGLWYDLMSSATASRSPVRARWIVWRSVFGSIMDFSLREARLGVYVSTEVPFLRFTRKGKVEPIFKRPSRPKIARSDPACRPSRTSIDSSMQY